MREQDSILVKDFSYSLPEEKIARYPLAERDASRLLIYDNGRISEDIYRNIAAHIPPGSLLVFNDTKVMEARILFQKPTGGTIEIFCLEPHEQYPDISTAMTAKESVWWQCLVGGASKWKHGQVLEKIIPAANETVRLQARFIEKRPDAFIIELSWTPHGLSFAELLHYAGAIPLPPYIKRAAETTDKERYQTIYAKEEGSVAAPTAGLHFTPAMFKSLSENGIGSEYVTLHVGSGTFKPVKAETLGEHTMHAEWMEVSRNTVEHLQENIPGNIVAVGTTSLRTLESLYWLGVKSSGFAAGSQEDGWLQLGQWEAYDPEAGKLPVKDALQSLLTWMDTRNLSRLIAKTQLLVAPGYRFRIVKGLVTNFHLPQSTLLLLVAALIGPDWRKVYDYALEKDFRFLSYGDGSLLMTGNASMEGQL